MKILALDIATKTGWATRTASGVWDFKLQRDESKGMRLIRFRAKLVEICKAEKIDVVCFERVAGAHQNAVIIAAELVGILKAFCEDKKIEYRAFSASEIKRHATGKGNANKLKMIAAAKEKLGYEGDEDNEADALWIYDLAINRFKQGE